MPQGEPQLEPVEPVVLPAEAAAVPLQPESVSPIAAPLGARAPEAAGMRDVMALTSPGERRRFVLQLQRTAGNAAVCRWLDALHRGDELGEVDLERVEDLVGVVLGAEADLALTGACVLDDLLGGALGLAG